MSTKGCPHGPLEVGETCRTCESERERERDSISQLGDATGATDLIDTHQHETIFKNIPPGPIAGSVEFNAAGEIVAASLVLYPSFDECVDRLASWIESREGECRPRELIEAEARRILARKP